MAEPWRRLPNPTPVADEERQALRAEGLDPDDPAVVVAIDLVRWELSLAGVLNKGQVRDPDGSCANIARKYICAGQMVPPAGFEPAAFCSGGRRSIP